MAQTNINIRMDENLKREYEAILSELGLNLTTSFNIFAKTVVREKRIPFEIALNIPNAETISAMQEVEDMISGKIQAKSYASFSELLKEVEADV